MKSDFERIIQRKFLAKSSCSFRVYMVYLIGLTLEEYVNTSGWRKKWEHLESF